MKRVHVMLGMVLALVLGGVACGASPDKVTLGDRLTNHQTVGAAALSQAQTGVALAALAMDPPAIQKAIVALRIIEIAVADARSNSEQLEKNFGGAPEGAEDYNPDASKKSREQSDKEHSAKPWYAVAFGWLTTIVGVGATALGVATAAVNAPGLGPLLLRIPYLGRALQVLTAGKTLKIAEQVTGGAAEIRKEVIEGKPLTPARVLEILESWQTPDTKPVITKMATAQEVAEFGTTLKEVT